MVANIRGYTPNYNFKLVNFDTPRWHTLEYANWSQVDAMFLQLGTPPVRGEWQNSIQYVVGDRVFEAETSQLYRCLVTHTSAATGTFAADRLANPSYWTIQILGVPLFRGDWLAGAVYALGDIVVTGEYHYHLCVVSHTSSTTFPPDDVFWVTVFDATNVVLDTEAAATNAANSAAAAAASAAEAATSADVAEQAASLAVTAQSAFRWNFDASTVAADPGMGEVRFNNATLINITQLMLSAQSADFGNPNVSGWVITWDDSTNLTSRGSIYVRNAASPENFLVFDVNGPVVDNGTWQSVTVKYIAHGGSLADGDNLAVAFTRTGNAGTSGSGAGDMLSTNNLSDVADPVAAADNIGVGPTDTPSFVQVVLSSPATIPNHATRKEYVDSAGAALQANIDTKAPLASPVFTGNPTAPTPTAGDNDTSIATTAFVTAADAALQTSIKTYVDNQDALKADITYVNAQDALKAPIASPTFTGDPKAPTPSAGDNDTTIATTAFVANAVASGVVAYAAPFDAMAYSGLQTNGAMEVSQEKGGALVTPASGYIVDGWLVYTGGFVVSAQQVADGPVGVTSSLKVSVTTAVASIGAGDYIQIYHPIEGYRTARLWFGSAVASPITIGFWVKAHRTGSYSGNVANGANNRVYVFSFAVSAADTWEYKTTTIPGDVTGTWTQGNSIGLALRIAVAAGTTYQIPAGVWAANNAFGATGTINGGAATSDTFQITGVIVLPGNEASSAARSPYIMRPYDQELMTCRRYWQTNNFVLSGYNVAGGAIYGPFLFSPMRAAPTVTLPGWSSSNAGGIVAGSITNGSITMQATATATGAAYAAGGIVCDARL